MLINQKPAFTDHRKLGNSSDHSEPLPQDGGAGWWGSLMVRLQSQCRAGFWPWRGISKATVRHEMILDRQEELPMPVQEALRSPFDSRIETRFAAP